MHDHNENKKTRRIAAVIYMLLMTFIMIGTTLSEQQKATAKNTVSSVHN